jgi:uncharacterized membrane protein
MNKWTQAFRKIMLSGLLVVVPLGITVFVLKLLYNFTAGRLSPLVREHLGHVPDCTSPIVASILLFAFIYLMGLIASVVVGKRIIAFLEKLIRTIPFVKSIYGASKQVVESLAFTQGETAYKIPVLIEFPSPGMKCIGLALGKIAFQDGREFYNVFVPTTPNITVGLYLLVAPEDVFNCGLTLDEAVRIIVSGGILGPEKMELIPASVLPLQAQANDDEEEKE